jgi:glycosyltransferase involved in cell wall biosynthesis
MHITYADAGLATEIGHHANSCRFITGAMRARGHRVTVAAYQCIEPELASALQASPHFRLNTYWGNDGDPVCGWLNAFFTGANVFAADLARLGPFTNDDLLYVNSILPAQLMGLRGFLLGLPDHERPRIVTELGTGPGLDLVTTDAGPRFVARDPRIDSRAVLYRFAGTQIKASPLPHLHVCSFDRAASGIYATLLGCDVQTLPVPHFSDAVARPRGATRPIVIGVLGHQRGEKGYQLLPAIAEHLLNTRRDIRLLVHNAQPEFMAEAQLAMRALAARDDRVTLDETPAGPAKWRDLLDRCDLILCPYMPEQFRAAYSAIASEAIAHGIPLVVPADTTLSRVVADFGGPGTAFDAHTPRAVIAAVIQALDGFDELAARAMTAAVRWRATMGAGAMVDAMLAMTAGADMLARPTRRAAAPAKPIPAAKVA